MTAVNLSLLSQDQGSIKISSKSIEDFIEKTIEFYEKKT